MGQTIGKYISCCKNTENLNYEINGLVTSFLKMTLYKDILEILTEGNDILVIKSFKFNKNKYTIFNLHNEYNEHFEKLVKHFVDSKNNFQYTDFLIFLFPVTNHLENNEEDLVKLIKNFSMSNNEKISYYEIKSISYVELTKFFKLFIFYQTKFIVEMLENVLCKSKDYQIYSEMYSEFKINDYAEYLCENIKDYSKSKQEMDLLNIRFELLIKWIKKHIYICDDISLRIDYERFCKENIISV